MRSLIILYHAISSTNCCDSALSALISNNRVLWEFTADFESEMGNRAITAADPYSLEIGMLLYYFKIK